MCSRLVCSASRPEAKMCSRLVYSLILAEEVALSRPPQLELNCKLFSAFPGLETNKKYIINNRNTAYSLILVEELALSRPPQLPRPSETAKFCRIFFSGLTLPSVGNFCRQRNSIILYISIYIYIYMAPVLYKTGLFIGLITKGLF